MYIMMQDVDECWPLLRWNIKSLCAQLKLCIEHTSKPCCIEDVDCYMCSAHPGP